MLIFNEVSLPRLENTNSLMYKLRNSTMSPLGGASEHCHSLLWSKEKVQSRIKLDKAILNRPTERLAPKRLIWTNSTDQKVYDMLVEQGPLTRDELVAHTKVARTTIYDALTRLSIRGLVTRFTEPRQSRGRRRVFYNVVS